MSLEKKILVVSQYYYPEQFRINDICAQWVSRGYDVTVLTGIPNYPQGEFYPGYGWTKKRSDTVDGVKIRRIPLVARKKGSVFLGLNYLSFVISGEIWKMFNKETFDLVFIYEVSPMTQALPAVRFAKKKKIPCYIYVMDLWPENFEIVSGIHNKSVIGSLNKMVNYIYKNCHKIFTASESFRNNIIGRGVAEDKVIFWPQYAEPFYAPSKNAFSEIENIDGFKITFAGNIGTAQGLDILPEVASRLKEKNVTVKFILVGNGRYKNQLQENIKEKSVGEYFHFVDPVPAETIPAIMNSSDMSLVSLKDDEIYRMTIPAKVQSSMACGIPILLSASGEVQQVISKSQCGVFVDPGKPTELADVIEKVASLPPENLKLMGDRGRLYYEKHYEREQLLDKMDCYFEGEV